MTDRVPVSEALKLVTPFKGDRREVLAFVANVDTAFEVIDPFKADTQNKWGAADSDNPPESGELRGAENVETHIYRKEDA